MPTRPTMAHLSERSPRCEDWRAILGATSAPILSPVPHKAMGPDGTIQEFYKLDVAALSPIQLDRLVATLAPRFGLEPDVIRAAATRPRADPRTTRPAAPSRSSPISRSSTSAGRSRSRRETACSTWPATRRPASRPKGS